MRRHACAAIPILAACLSNADAFMAGVPVFLVSPRATAAFASAQLPLGLRLRHCGAPTQRPTSDAPTAGTTHYCRLVGKRQGPEQEQEQEQEQERGASGAAFKYMQLQRQQHAASSTAAPSS